MYICYGNFRTDLLLKANKPRVLLLQHHPLMRPKRRPLSSKFRYLPNSVDIYQLNSPNKRTAELQIVFLSSLSIRKLKHFQLKPSFFQQTSTCVDQTRKETKKIQVHVTAMIAPSQPWTTRYVYNNLSIHINSEKDSKITPYQTVVSIARPQLSPILLLLIKEGRYRVSSSMSRVSKMLEFLGYLPLWHR